MHMNSSSEYIGPGKSGSIVRHIGCDGPPHSSHSTVASGLTSAIESQADETERLSSKLSRLNITGPLRIWKDSVQSRVNQQLSNSIQNLQHRRRPDEEGSSSSGSQSSLPSSSLGKGCVVESTTFGSRSSLSDARFARKSSLNPVVSERQRVIIPSRNIDRPTPNESRLISGRDISKQRVRGFKVRELNTLIESEGEKLATVEDAISRFQNSLRVRGWRETRNNRIEGISSVDESALYKTENSPESIPLEMIAHPPPPTPSHRDVNFETLENEQLSTRSVSLLSPPYNLERSADLDAPGENSVSFQRPAAIRTNVKSHSETRGYSRVRKVK